MSCLLRSFSWHFVAAGSCTVVVAVVLARLLLVDYSASTDQRLHRYRLGREIDVVEQLERTVADLTHREAHK